VANDLSKDGTLGWRWFGGHYQRGKLESANLAFGDGHVERRPGSTFQPRYCGGKQGIDTWNWR
jgi:prepilin-type processing-associated H-X9-DG protein